MSSSLQNLDFYLTIPHECSYYSDRMCQNIIPDPNKTIQATEYGELATLGFRRSGNHVYRPHCPECAACIACRVEIRHFKWHRNHRRCMKRNRDVAIHEVAPAVTEEYFALYQRYLNSRHADGDMKDPAEADFENFLVKGCAESSFIEFRLDQILIAIAVVDRIKDGLSAVYTFYDPDMKDRSLGTFAILTEIELCKNRNLPYLYLGYWIDQHPKMHYKAGFDGLQYFLRSQWIPGQQALK